MFFLFQIAYLIIRSISLTHASAVPFVLIMILIQIKLPSILNETLLFNLTVLSLPTDTVNPL